MLRYAIKTSKTTLCLVLVFWFSCLSLLLKSAEYKIHKVQNIPRTRGRLSTRQNTLDTPTSLTFSRLSVVWTTLYTRPIIPPRINYIIGTKHMENTASGPAINTL